MKINNNSLRKKILEYLNSVHSIPKKELHLHFPETVYNNFSRAVKILTDDGDIEVFRYKQLNHVRITPSGIKKLKEKEEIRYETESIRKEALHKSNTTKRRKRQALNNTVFGVCKAAGVLVKETEKPMLRNLFDKYAERLSELSPEDEKRLFVKSLSNGIFYTSGEVREILNLINQKDSISNKSRLIGIVFKDKRIVFVYAINDTLIHWEPLEEERTVANIQNGLIQSKIIRENIDMYRYPDCVVVGKGFAMIPRLVRGRKSGSVSANKRIDEVQTGIAKNIINAHNLSKVFNSAYYVPVNKKGINLFKEALIASQEYKDEKADEWFEEVKNATRIKSKKYYQGFTQKMENLAYLYTIDLIELSELMEQNVELHLVAPDGTAEALSRVFGPNIKSVRNHTGKKQRYRSYDSNGNLAETRE